MNWPTSHLDEAAAAWEKSADQSEQAFSKHVANVRAPGGTVWTGAGANAAYDDARDAQDTVAGHCSVKRECARIARRGAEEIRGAQRTVVSAIEEVQDKGYSVAEDLTAADASTGGTLSERVARRAEAAQLTEYLRWHARGLADTDARVARELTAEAQGLQGRKLSGGDGTQMLDDHQGGDGQDGQSGYTPGQFKQDGVEEGGTPGFDKEHNAQGIRTDEGVLIQGNRILFGDGLAWDDKTHSYRGLDTPMYHYHLDQNGMPILDGPPISGHPEQGEFPPGTRDIPLGSTGPNPMPNGQGLLFASRWVAGPPGSSQDPAFSRDTMVYDTRGNGPFPPVATIQGLRAVTAVPYGDSNRLLISGVTGEGPNASRVFYVTPEQSAPGNWDFLDQHHWTPVLGPNGTATSLPVNGDLSADLSSNLSRFDTPSGTQYVLSMPNPDSSGVDMRVGATPEGMASAPATSVFSQPGTFHYSPNVTQVTPLPGGGYDLSMTISQRQIPDGVPLPDLGHQTYRNIFGHVPVMPPP